MIDSEREVKRQVREFYDRVGWKEVSDGVFQNARYEDLRPVSQEYIHRCHQRVGRHLVPTGRLFLDAGSGPIQYPEYVAYSEGFAKRICADISMTALKAARERIGAKGSFVVSDISHLPFAPNAFDAVVSLHTIHHLPVSQHIQAYLELHRVLAPGRRAAVVNGWDYSPLNQFFDRIKTWLKGRKGVAPPTGSLPEEIELGKGTFVNKQDARWLKSILRGKLDYKILVWRSASTNVLRFFIREEWLGRFWLRVLFALEELFPRFFGEKGLYPLVVISK
ncbi:MAG TPA: class I SAM-dependent methyltransferase [Anaerolineales bacterium]|nr:class I SAM-dependent methyltransferase [Anaerolineales bacterium]